MGACFDQRRPGEVPRLRSLQDLGERVSEARARAEIPGLGRFPLEVQRRVRAAWADAELSKSNIIERFKMPVSCYLLLLTEIGPRPREGLVMRPGFKPRSFARST